MSKKPTVATLSERLDSIEQRLAVHIGVDDNIHKKDQDDLKSLAEYVENMFESLNTKVDEYIRTNMHKHTVLDRRLANRSISRDALHQKMKDRIAELESYIGAMKDNIFKRINTIEQYKDTAAVDNISSMRTEVEAAINTAQLAVDRVNTFTRDYADLENMRNAIKDTKAQSEKAIENIGKVKIDVCNQKRAHDILQGKVQSLAYQFDQTYTLPRKVHKGYQVGEDVKLQYTGGKVLARNKASWGTWYYLIETDTGNIVAYSEKRLDIFNKRS